MSDAQLEVSVWDRDHDYPHIAAWWAAAGIDAMPADCFPPHGFVARIDGKPIAATFCFLTDARCAWVAFTVATPDLRGPQRLAGIEGVLRAAIDRAREFTGEGGFIWSMTDHPKLQALYVERLGFKASGMPGNYVIPGQGVPTGMLI